MSGTILCTTGITSIGDKKAAKHMEIPVPAAFVLQVLVGGQALTNLSNAISLYMGTIKI